MSGMRLARRREIASNMIEWTLEAGAPLPEVQPGSFVHIAAGEYRLRRPISVMDAEEAEGRLILGISPRGEGTRRLCALPEGSEIDLLGPMGSGFRPPTEEQARAGIWLIGGGIGVAPLILAARRFGAARAYLGFQTGAMAYGMDRIEVYGARVSVATDDGSLGERGFVTELLERALGEDPPCLLLACGPEPMLRAVKRLAERFGIPAQVSLEQRMACGVGACLVCSCAAEGGGYLRVCRDGPVFDAGEVKL